MCLHFDRLSSAPILNWPVIITDLFTKVNTAMIIKGSGYKKQRPGNVKPRAFLFYYLCPWVHSNCPEKRKLIVVINVAQQRATQRGAPGLSGHESLNVSPLAAGGKKETLFLSLSTFRHSFCLKKKSLQMETDPRIWFDPEIGHLCPPSRPFLNFYSSLVLFTLSSGTLCIMGTTGHSWLHTRVAAKRVPFSPPDVNLQ